ncbi:molecular chaperone GrpE [Halorubrum alkaliphilum]|uniref:Protein GrpE n=1 Tax=Halorubrum alkaliphilum TaxID=261290 RepID=A0A8T4GBP0_9EURY|nr:nucleotide exchange factor GrpE [Halorubrum alkaliphilum]MBP1921247.1 molecular chaperone GrpE [Halorubrum alkaliphilum]
MSDDDAVEVETPESDDAVETTDAAGAADAAEATESSEDENTTAEPSDLADRVADYDAELADEVAELETELDERREEVDELTSKLARVRADFSNYKERAKRKRDEIRERASEALVERIAPVRNDLLRALDQEAGSDLRPGVESTLEKFDEVLADEGVDPIDPDPGSEVDPARHQVMLRVESDQPEGTVHEVYEPGYEMGDRVITEAQVTVSAGDE